MKITSNSFKNGEILPEEQVLNLHGCTGGNISPDLSWEDFPSDTKEFALIMHDPDAPVENGWYHWVVLNIPKNISSLKKGEEISAPMAIGRTTFTDVNGYGGACPPRGHGVHHYNFTIYALGETLPEELKNKTPVEIEKVVKSKAVDFSTITAIYER